MNKSLAARRMAENEVVFRKYNESIQHGYDALVKVAKEDGQEELMMKNDTPLHFYCECSDENCHQRIVLSPDEYADLHEKRDHFILMHDHETKSIERVVRKESTFSVVKKFILPSSASDTLNTTDVNNT